MAFEGVGVLCAVLLALALLGSSDYFSEASVVEGFVGGLFVSIFAEQVVVFVALDGLCCDWLDVEDALHVGLSALASCGVVVISGQHFEVFLGLLRKHISKVGEHFVRLGVAKVGNLFPVFFLEHAAGRNLLLAQVRRQVFFFLLVFGEEVHANLANG